MSSRLPPLLPFAQAPNSSAVVVKPRAGQHGHPGTAADERVGRVAGGPADREPFTGPVERLAVGVGPQEQRPVAELGGAVPQCGEHQVRLLPVVAAAP